MKRIYTAIGNSDNSLSQSDWAKFQGEFSQLITGQANKIWEQCYSAPTAEWQNMCVGFDCDDEKIGSIQIELRELASKYRQDSIAWSEVKETILIK
jgi:hypothetical protein